MDTLAVPTETLRLVLLHLRSTADAPDGAQVRSADRILADALHATLSDLTDGES